MAALLLDTEITIATPEQAAYRYRVAGPLARAGAFLIDVLLALAVILLAWFVAGLLGFLAGGFGTMRGLGMLATFLVVWVAGAVVEWRWKGRTPGKAIFGLRTVTLEGGPPPFGVAVLRTLLRSADALPTVAMALVTMTWTEGFRRLGDLAAGTIVVHEDERWILRRRIIPMSKAEADLAARLPAEVGLVVDAPALRAITAYVQRRQDYHDARRRELAGHYAGPLAARLGLPPSTDPDRLLVAVHHRLTGAVDDRALARGAAYLAKREGEWARLERLAAEPQPSPLDFARLYRSASADLALAEALHLPHRVLAQLHRTVALAHRAFHPPASLDRAGFRRLVLVEVPGRLYGDACLRIAVIAFFGTFLLAMLLAAMRPGTAEAVLGAGFVDRLHDMYLTAPQDRSADEAVAMHGFYISNNVGITLACFAAGVFLGVGSLIMLVFNGVVLGMAFGVMLIADDATRQHFFTFVMAHGPCELTGIALGGAAGLRLGLGVVDTGGLPRLEGLRRSAAQALPILGVAAGLVALAAPIEAWVSPSSLPPMAKALVALVTALGLIGYLIVLGARARREVDRG
jgi:uncharacterized RDD family membrane protein YckC/uncharacterized membrane protein SpoIIM required for sporulation